MCLHKVQRWSVSKETAATCGFTFYSLSLDFSLASGTFFFVKMKAALLEVMPPTLWRWPTMSEADVGGMAEEAESSHQCSITFCCRVTDSSRGTVWQNRVWYGSAYEAKGCSWILPCGINGTHWHLSMLACVMFMGMVMETTVDVSTVVVTMTVGHLHWYRFVWAQHAGSCSLLVKMHSEWWWLCLKTVS